MQKTPLSKTLVPLFVAALLLALPAAAQANIAFTRASSSGANSTVYTATDSGKAIHKIGAGRNPYISPDGATVAYFHEGPGHQGELKVVPVDGSGGQTLMSGWQEPFEFAWSPDSEFILALRGPELGQRKLVLITVATGAQKVLVTGFFYGFSWSGEGHEIFYAKANSEKYPPRSDIYEISPAGGEPVALTSDHRSLDPLWGPAGKIAFVKLLDADKRKYGPKNEIYVMHPSGKRVERLTHTNVDPLLQGLFPTAWSGNGKKLLAEFEGQDTSYAVGVNALTGTQKPIGPAGETGFVGTALSNDGATVLGFEGGFDPGNRHTVVTRPFGGAGKAKVLVKNASEPDWSL
ncbi:MAG TPA: hypothetical protein VFJ57_10040 [Solirubrobacterales bacterium]|nr:hypothetical protein [Solirubrobacterales bacterium]